MDANLNDVYLRLGHLEGRMGAVETRVGSVDAKVDTMGTKLDTVIAYIERQKGGKRMFVAVVTVAASAFGWIGAAAFEWYTGRHA
jgi:hypothetical protein